MSEIGYPKWYSFIKGKHGKFIEALEKLGEVVRKEGPLDEKTSQLIQLAAAATIRSEGSVHSHARRALNAGAKPEEIYHTVILLTSTIGFPNIASALSWVHEEIEEKATLIKCASTTSTQNSGLFDYILPIFKQKTGIQVDVVAVGTGAAIEVGKRGDSDVLFCHAKEEELKAAKEGWFIDRHDLMYNDFVIIGPNDDPLKIKGVKSASEAFKKIGAQDKVPFVSRGDKSGTHTKELSIWKKAGLDPKSQKWYLEAGKGMEKTQLLANEKQAYTLTDRGTWLATKDKDKLKMDIVLEDDRTLFNQYGVMAVNPKKHPQAKYNEAKQFIDWLISPEGQKAIGDFRDKHGNQLFTPNAK
jgi:tungstate transport system substrate-binding protein